MEENQLGLPVITDRTFSKLLQKWMESDNACLV